MFDVRDYRWVVLESGFIAYRVDQAYYVRVETIRRIKENELKVKSEPDCVIPINFHLVTEDLFITNVIGCQNPDMIVIVLSNNLQESIFLVWSLVENREIRNYSITGNYSFVHGPNSETGYILTGFKYINLDYGLPNYFFDYNFAGFTITNPNGYKVNMNEELILQKGNILMKTLYMETVSLTRYLKGIDKIEENQLTSHNLKFQIQGNTCLHLFALDNEALQLILDFLAENRPNYLNSILMRNFDGYTPLDITIDRDSPKNTDLLLTALSTLKEANYSEQLYTKFPQLLQMELKSFHRYLASCMFQTIQMRSTKYLSLKEDEDVLIVAHNSCVLDRNFIEKYTTQGLANRELREKQKEILERERKFAKEQRKIQEAERKRREEKRKKRVKKVKNRRTGKSSARGTPFSASRGIKSGDIYLEEKSSSRFENAMPGSSYYSSEYSSYYDDDDSYDDSSYYGSSPQMSRFYPESNLNAAQLAQIQQEKEKIDKKKLEAKQRKMKLREQKKKEQEEKERIQQEQIMAEKKRLDEERARQKEAHRKGLKKYEISAIEFDWLFNETHGRELLVHLSKTQSIDVFSIDLIRNIVMFLWVYYRRAILLRVFFPFLIYFVCFLAYATYIRREKVKEDDAWGDWFIANFVLIMVILVSIIYNIYFEVRKFMFYGWWYFKSFWNFIINFSTFLNSFVVLADLGYLDDEYFVPFLAVGTFLMWLRLIYFGRMFFSTAWMVRMIYSVTQDMRYFLLIFAISVVAFANSYDIISRNGTPSISGEDLFDGIVYSYQTGLGEFDLDNFDENRDIILVYFLWVMSTFLILIVFLNLLIAIISDIFDKVHENINNNLMKELVYFMVESEVIIRRRKIFKNDKYMIIVARERGETGEFDADSKLSVIRHSMDVQVNRQKGIVDEIKKNLERKMRERIQSRGDAIESSSNKQIATLSDKIEETEHLHNKYKVLFDTIQRMEI